MPNFVIYVINRALNAVALVAVAWRVNGKDKFMARITLRPLLLSLGRVVADGTLV